MSIELLMEGATAQLDERQNQLLAAAHAEVGRLKHLVEELLDLEIEAGRIDLEFDRVPVALALRTGQADLWASGPGPGGGDLHPAAP